MPSHSTPTLLMIFIPTVALYIVSATGEFARRTGGLLLGDIVLFGVILVGYPQVSIKIFILSESRGAADLASNRPAVVALVLSVRELDGISSREIES